jgi:hypothetical protein
MAVEVIKRGEIPETEQSFAKVCGHCKSHLRFMSGDAKRQHHGAGYNHFEPAYFTYTIDCPVCKKPVQATSNK